MDGCQKMELQTSNFETDDLEDEDLNDSYDGDYYGEYDPDDQVVFKQDAFATKIVLVDRGTCSFTQKVRNAERAGASLVVVIDDRQEDIQNVIMGDDGTGMGIRIPSMLIGKDSGKILKDFAVTADARATLSAEFTLANPNNYSEMQLWYSSNTVLALDFIKEFDKYRHELGDYLRFSPHVVTYPCPSCATAYKQDECFSNGKYCAPNHNMLTDGYIKGRDIILEDLRQICLHKRLQDDWNEPAWWDYVKYVHQECYGLITEECSKDAHAQIGESYETTMACVNDSFIGKTG